MSNIDLVRLKSDLLSAFKTKRKTACFIEGNTLKVIYHDTKVAEITDEGVITLNSGGYRTSTTKSRLNDVLNACLLELGGTDFEKYGVVQMDYVWYLTTPKGRKTFYDNIEVRL